MEQEVIKSSSYKEFKIQLDNELEKAAEGFVKIGYLLKVARDTNVLEESGYQTVAEFAKAEYGLSKDVVSRYIAINDRYSQGGYSDQLEEKYKDYGVAKLQEMLTLPDMVIESMSPEMTRKDIQGVKKEVLQEEQISDIEVMLEGKNKAQEEMQSNLHKVMHQYMYEHREEYALLHKALKEETKDWIDGILDVLAPSGVAMKSIRLSGVGKFMLSIQGADNDLDLINIRSNEKEVYTWCDLHNVLSEMCMGIDGKEEWEEIYGEPFEEKKENTKVAPVQPEEQEPEDKTNNKEQEETRQEVLENNDEKEPCVAAGERNNEEEENKEKLEPEQQVQGQMRVEDYPELMPDEENKGNIAMTEEKREEYKEAIVNVIRDAAEMLVKAAEIESCELMDRHLNFLQKETEKLKELVRR